MTYLVAQDGDVPIARATSISNEFWEGCRRGELLHQRCTNCDTVNFPPVVACRRCCEPALKWERGTGKGSLYSWTVVWRPQSDRFRVPYAPAIVDMAEGHQMLTNIVNCHTEDLHLGIAVEVVFTPTPGGRVLPYFQPAQGKEG